MSKRNSRIRSLDILRVLAVFLVLGRHIESPPDSIGPFFSSLVFYWNQGGWVGVDLFFVLSGFLISGLLFREHQRSGNISFKDFFIRRGFKIYPAFYTFLFIAFVFNFRPAPSSIKPVLIELLFLQSYASGLWGHTWSLAVEEHFYLLLPFVLIYLSRDKRNSEPFKNVPWIFLGAAALCFIARVFTALLVHPYSYLTHLFPTHLRIDSLFFGVLLSFFYHYARPQYEFIQKRFRHIFPWLGPALLLPAFLSPLQDNVYLMTAGFPLIYMGSGMILMAMLEREARFTGRTAAVLAFIGSCSYSIYIWHTYAIHLCSRVLESGGSWGVYALLCLIVPILAGVLMALAVERPMLRLRERCCRPLDSL